MYYFAYGSNLSKKQMLERCPGSQPRFTTTLPNYRLVFVGWSRQWRGGVASIRASRGDKVPGAVYEISEADLRHLDKYEGYPNDYNRLKVTVFDEDGTALEAVTYIKSRPSEETEPSREYLARLEQGYRDWGIM